MGNSLQAYLCLDISDIFRNVSKYILRTPNVSLNGTVVYAEIFWKKMLSKSYQSNSTANSVTMVTPGDQMRYLKL